MTDGSSADRPVAIALGYDPRADHAPKVLASGYGHIARAILKIAREENIHIHQDDTLAQLLARAPVGMEIPEQAYQLVAELLSFLCRIDRQLAEKISASSR